MITTRLRLAGVVAGVCLAVGGTSDPAEAPMLTPSQEAKVMSDTYKRDMGIEGSGSMITCTTFEDLSTYCEPVVLRT